MKKATAIAALLGGLLPIVALAASSWWNNDWKYRKEVTFDLSATGADVAGSVQDVPVLVRLSLANFAYFGDTKPDGSDFRLLAGDDKTPLKFHFEKYDVQNQLALLWVRVPQLTGGAKTEKIYAYYGNSDAATAADVAGTYDPAQVLVLSFSDPGNTPTDLTAYKNNPSSSTAELTPASLIGGGAKFSGKESILIPATASLRLLPGQGITASAWVRIEQAQQAVVFALSDQGKSLSLNIDGAKFVAHLTQGGAPVSVTQPADLALNQWHHVAVSAGAGKLTLYVDGTAAGSAPVTLEEIGGTLSIGAQNGTQFFSGELDEMQVSKAARPAEWIKASARSQGMDSNLIVYGPDGQREGSGGQGSYFVTIAKNLTLDGWVVIGICLAMLAVAIVIMIVKAIYLRQVERANAAFMQVFRRISGGGIEGAPLEKGPSDEKTAAAGAALLAAAAKYRASTLFRLYEDGINEVHKRIGGQTVSAQRVQILSPQSIAAINASMDSTMTRLQQRLSSQMVLLTIAISGGPFLGLLGTVIGVMITFAAIALSGDVNVNAIAPGTAAALAATVAGLAVAIPSLFGYNWLNTRIKSINADNRVFVDEFVARLAEQYS
jgi:biopolymer transport protein ExbB